MYYTNKMNDTSISLRLTDALARALAAESSARGVAKSLLVREAVATYLAAPGTSRIGEHLITAAEFARAWKARPALTAEEGREFADDIARARNELGAPTDPWA